MKKYIHKIQKIFQANSSKLITSSRLPYHKIKTIHSIESCRTSSFGYHVDTCYECDYTKISYNSCRNRHCPICQNISKEEWIDARKSELINSQYFHIVFTLPDILNPILYNNQKLLYDLMFKCSSETLLELSSDHKYLGAQIGITSVLHTWGQTLSYHPHIHCIVPGGGLSSSDLKFIHSKRKFFLPVKVVSKKFKGKFLSHLNKLICQNTIKLPSKISKSDFDTIIKNSYSIDWVVYCKPPFKNPHHVIEYLGRYTHKVAINDSRILHFDKNTVTFKYRDYKDRNKEKSLTLSSFEFLRRFLLHVLPKKFFKIRYYGILSTRNRKTKLLKCQKLSGIDLNSTRRHTKKEILEKLFGENINFCPICNCKNLSRRFIPSFVLRE